MDMQGRGQIRTRDLTTGSITGNLLLFALPLMAGNLLQQLYNVADTWVVGRFLGADALAAVGSAYTLMTFLTSILLGGASCALHAYEIAGSHYVRLRDLAGLTGDAVAYDPALQAVQIG